MYRKDVNIMKNPRIHRNKTQAAVGGEGEVVAGRPAPPGQTIAAG